MYSDYKKRVEAILNNPFLIPDYIPNTIYEISKRRKKIYFELMKTLAPQKGISILVGKMPIDFEHIFRHGSTGHRIDDEYLQLLFERILMNLGMEPIDRFNEHTALQFRRAIFRAIQSNKTELGFYSHKLQTGDYSFKPITNSNSIKKIQTQLRKIIPNSQHYKLEIKCMSDCIIHGMSTGVECIVVTSLDCVENPRISSKCNSSIANILNVSPDECPEIRSLSKCF